MNVTVRPEILEWARERASSTLLELAQAVIRSAQTGQTLMRDAYELLGVKKHKTFLNLAETMEVAD